MKLYLVRHGEALSEHVDPERPLSDKGRADATAMAAFLGRAGVRVPVVQHSGKARARETAEILAQAVAGGSPTQRSDIAPLADVDSLVDEANARDEDLMVVGHLPFMGRAVSALLAGRDDLPIAGFRECACACLVRSRDGTWTLAWLIAPDLIRH